MSPSNNSFRCFLNLLGDEFRYLSESFAVIHVDDQIVTDTDVLRVVQELE